jgi:hypothetical protein
VRALDFGGAVDAFTLAEVRAGGHVGGRTPGAEAEGDWAEYVRGMAWAMLDAGLPLTRGWDGVVAGDVPVGAGLSSSAALELAAARAFAASSDVPWAATRMAQLAQRAENVWVGVNCGIMDQLISAEGPGRARAAHRLPLARPAPVPGAGDGGVGGARHGHPPRPRGLGVQRAPAPVRGGRRATSA